MTSNKYSLRNLDVVDGDLGVCICSALGRMAPCGFCTSLTQEDVDFYDKYGRYMINMDDTDEDKEMIQADVMIDKLLQHLETTISYKGYHLDNIPKGELYKSSKIMEELLELQDAEKQGCKIMQLVELSDLVLSIMQYTYSQFGRDFDIHDLIKMAGITERAFLSGERKSD